MAKKKVNRPIVVKHVSPLASLWSFVIWVTGVLVSLAVGFGMAYNTLIIPRIPEIVTSTTGWFVVVLTVLGVLLKVVDKLSW